MNIGERSYDVKKRKDMLLRWANVMNCKWLLDDKITQKILKRIEVNEAILPTPLNIKDFIMASLDKKDLKEIVVRLEEKSKATAESFANQKSNL